MLLTRCEVGKIVHSGGQTVRISVETVLQCCSPTVGGSKDCDTKWIASSHQFTRHTVARQILEANLLHSNAGAQLVQCAHSHDHNNCHDGQHLAHVSLIHLSLCLLLLSSFFFLRQTICCLDCECNRMDGVRHVTLEWNQGIKCETYAGSGSYPMSSI